MSKITPRLSMTPAKAPQAAAASASPAATVVAPRDSFVASAPAQKLRALSREIAAILAFSPRTAAQAEAWQAKSQAARAELDSQLATGALKSLPLKERSELKAASHRLDGLIEDLPGIIRFVAGE